MGKQSRAKKPDSVGKGKVTPVQVAFIVDRYLSDNNFAQTRSVFRAEASSLVAKSPVNEAPRGLLSLGAMLDEYISLKEQKVMVDQERARLEQERWRIQTLLQSMQEAMTAFNSGGGGGGGPGPSTPAVQASVVNPSPPSVNPSGRSPQGCLVGNATPVMPPSSAPTSQTIVMRQSSSSQLTLQSSSSKRKVANTAPKGPSGAKKPRGVVSSTSKRLPIRSSMVIEGSSTVESNPQSADLTAFKVSPQNSTASGSLAQGSSIAKRLFYPPPHSTPTKSVPTTPPQGSSSRSDKSASSSMETFSAAECSNSNTNTPEGITPTHCTVVSYEKITVSPYKQVIERGQCISSSSPAKRVKGRLDFNDSIPEVSTSVENESSDNTSTSESEKEIDYFDLDFPNLDVFGANFSFSELLVDFDFDNGDIDHSCGTMAEASDGTMAGLSDEPRENNLETDQLMAEYSATLTETHSENDIQIQGVNSNVMAVKSVTRCTSVLSPVKSPGMAMHQ